MTTTVRAGDPAYTYLLADGQVLTVSAGTGSTGVVYVYPATAGAQSTRTENVASGVTRQFGPYVGTVRLGVTCTAGSVESSLSVFSAANPSASPDGTREITAAEVASGSQDVALEDDPVARRLPFSGSIVRGRQVLFRGIPNSQTEAAGDFNYTAMQEILTAFEQTGCCIEFDKPYFFNRGNFVAKGHVILQGRGLTTPIIWKPKTGYTNTPFMVWSRPSAIAALTNEEGQLVGCGVRNIRLVGDRTSRANGFWFIGVDNPILDGEVYGVKGYAWKLSNCREGTSINCFARYCGYYDLANSANNVPAISMDVQSAAWDTTNLMGMGSIKSYYNFGPEIYLEGAYSNFIGGADIGVHQIGRGDGDFETNFVAAFPTYNGAAAAKGWDANGNPLNEYAAMHVYPGGGAVAAVTTSHIWQDSIVLCYPIHLKKNAASGRASERNRLGVGRVIGGGRLYCVFVEGAGSVSIENLEMTSAQPWAANVSVDASTDIATVSSLHSASVSTGVPPTGTPCMITGTPPTGMSNNVIYWVIRQSSTTLKFARTYAEAVAGTAINVTTAGSAVIAYAGGMPLCAVDGSTVVIDDKSYINDGNIAGWHDETSMIHGAPRTGFTFNNGPILRHASEEKLLFIAHKVRMDATGGTAMTKMFGGRRYVPTRAIAIQRGSVGNVSGATAGINTASGGGGTALVASSQTYTSLTGASTKQDLTLAVTTAVPHGSDSSSSPLYVYVGGASANAGAEASFYLYGLPVD